MKAPAVFLDRDGTLIEHLPYLANPDDVRLTPGASEAIRRLSRAGFSVVLVSNQSGVARGLFTEEELARVHARVESLLKGEGAALDATYYCPFLDGPEATVEAYRQDSDLRKPKPGMLLQAAGELNLDLARSWMIGDSAADIEAGARAGCRTMLVQSAGKDLDGNGFVPTTVVESLTQAVERILGEYDKVESDRTTGAGLGERSLHVLERVSAEIERLTRPRRQQDFSILLMIATLVQMLAILTGLWGAAAMYAGDNAAAAARFALAGFLLAAAIGAWVVDRFR